MMTINITYFAALREAAGRKAEIIETPCHTARELYEHLRMQYHFALSVDDVSVAINDVYKAMDTVLVENDHVVFIPPVAGG